MFSKVLGLFSKKRSQANAEAQANEEATATRVTESVVVPPPTATAEELCNLTDGMTHEELRDHLAKLYRRHNRAASSLNPELRLEAERMLDAIVEVRHTYLE